MEVQTDWDHLFDFHTSDGIFPSHQSKMSVDDIEQLLFKDDDDQVLALNCDGFLHDILLDSPLEEEKSGEVVDSAEDQRNVEEKDNSEHDPLAKKRKRQLRNRDAALRSRERKKMLVKDLEMKSRYYEGECRRLGSLLQWYMAENQALRFSLHSSNASMTKQESAVLLLESLLLGSLLWFMVSLVLLPHQRQSRLVTVVEEKHLPSLAPGNGGSKMLLVGKRFKASRSRMRHSLQHPTGFLIYLAYLSG